MKSTGIVLLCLTGVLFLACPETPEDEVNPYRQEQIPWPSLADSPWPMHHRDPQSTGRFEGVGAPNGEILWELDAYGTYYCSPVVGSDGTIYVVSSYDTLGPGVGNTVLKAINPAGTLRWYLPLLQDTTLTCCSWTYATPVVDQYDNIYVATWEGYLFKITPDGDILWEYPLGKHVFSNGLVLDYSGNILFVAEDGVLYAITPEGGLAWSTTIDRGFNPGNTVSISPEGQHLYLSISDSGLACLDSQGNLLYTYPTDDIVTSPPLVTSQSCVVFDTRYSLPDISNDLIAMISKDGQVQWNYHNEDIANWRLYSGFTIDPGGNIAFAHDLTLYSITYQGEPRWFFQSGPGGWTIPVCDAKGTVFVATSYYMENYLYAVSEQGTLRWQTPLPEYFRGRNSPAFSSEGVLYLTLDKVGGYYLSKLMAVY